MKKYSWEQQQIKDMKEYIARFGHGTAKVSRKHYISIPFLHFIHLQRNSTMLLIANLI